MAFHAPEDQLPPDAAARDAAKRAEAHDDEVLSDASFVFHTRHVSDIEKAAVIASLTQQRAEEVERARLVERKDREPWARSQRVVEGISDLLAEG